MPLPLKSKQHNENYLGIDDKIVVPSNLCEPNPCKYIMQHWFYYYVLNIVVFIF